MSAKICQEEVCGSIFYPTEIIIPSIQHTRLALAVGWALFQALEVQKDTRQTNMPALGGLGDRYTFIPQTHTYVICTRILIYMDRHQHMYAHSEG